MNYNVNINRNSNPIGESDIDTRKFMNESMSLVLEKLLFLDEIIDEIPFTDTIYFRMAGGKIG